MGIDRLYRVRCEFCHAAGPDREGETGAVRAGRECAKRITRIHLSYYGNEVWACGRCVETDEEAKGWAAMPDRGPDA